MAAFSRERRARLEKCYTEAFYSRLKDRGFDSPLECDHKEDAEEKDGPEPWVPGSVSTTRPNSP